MKSKTGIKYEFSEQEIAFIMEHFHKMTNRELATALDVTMTVVRNKCYEMGLKRMELEYWTEEQVKYLKTHYKKIGDVEIAEVFNVLYYKKKGWSKKHIEKKRRYLGLKRTPEQIQKINDRNKKQGRFSINHWKRWAGRVTPVGEIRTWKYKNGRPFMVIKLKDGFVHYAPWLWEQLHGPVPEGYIVRLKDNNPENVTPENLEIITTAENARRNTQNNPWYSYPLEFKQLIVLNNKLKKTLHATTDRKATAGDAEQNV